MRTIRIAVFALATGLFTLSLGAETVKCRGKFCGVSIDGVGIGPYTGSPAIVGPSEFNEAVRRSKDNTAYKCSPSACEGCGSGDWSAQINGGNAGIEFGTSSNPEDEVHVYGDPNTGQQYWFVNTHAMCMCTDNCYENGTCPMGAGDRIQANPYTSPVFTPINSFFKRLFGRGK